MVLPLALDAAADWATDPAVQALGSLDAVLCCNVIHIAPWAVAEGIVRGAAQSLAADASLILYGAFRRGGRHLSERNASFDAALRADNPDWGVRDLDDVAALAAKAGLGPARITAMPNNTTCWWRSAARGASLPRMSTDSEQGHRWHDMGGRDAGEIARGEHDHALWEKRVDALMRIASAKGYFTVDGLRRVLEDMPPDSYETMTYYERWIHSITQNLIEADAFTIEDLNARMEEVAARGATYGEAQGVGEGGAGE